MAKDRVAELKAAITAAEANGWTYIGNNTVRRMAEHVTPPFAMDNGWYPGSTYNSLEFMSFLLMGPSRAPKCIHGTVRVPWIMRSDRSISWKRTLELLAQPVTESDIHN